MLGVVSRITQSLAFAPEVALLVCVPRLSRDEDAENNHDSFSDSACGEGGLRHSDKASRLDDYIWAGDDLVVGEKGRRDNVWRTNIPGMLC